MILNKKNIASIGKQIGLDIPADELFSLPEKVLQFGTGVLLRGLPDYFIDKANKQGVFNGRVVIVKSTGQGGTDAFTRQDNLYTQCIRGIENGKRINEAVINASVSRVLTATEEWAAVLACAADPGIQVIISNTTEVGIVLHNNDDVNAAPPVSFPGKLLAFLLERYKKFNGSAESGMVIIPTELITENGAKLKNIVIELAKQNRLDDAFISWLSGANDFCNSLVDRIVPGQLPGDDKAVTESRLGYRDDLMIMSEVYRLWAIETASDRTKEILSFRKTDAGVILAPDIDKFRELKLRLLNGSHTFSCALAIQMGFATVKQAMEDQAFYNFISHLMLEEIVPAIVNDKVTTDAARQFAAAVLDRYSNPFIEHQWLSISLQYSSKMKMRNVPVLQQYYEKNHRVPRYMALGFAAYLVFMKSVKQNDNVYTGRTGDKSYTINDDRAAELYQLWQTGNTDNFVANTLASENLWGVNLAALPGFRDAVLANTESIQKNGMGQTLQQLQMQPAT
jgi:tagaturonate reductase